MTQEASSGILGISLIDDQLRIVEGIKSGDEFQVSRVAHGRIRQPFGFEAFSDKNIARRFAEDISRLCADQDFQAKHVAFSLDSSMVLIKKVPVDQALPTARMDEQIKWEVGQFAISSLGEYIVDYEELASNSQNGLVKDMLVVVVRKKIVEYLRQVFNYTDLRLKVVDVDLFSAQRALLVNYDHDKDEKIGLIDVEEKKAHFSILRGQQFFLSHDLDFPSNRSQFEDRDETAARIVSKELKKLILDEKIGKGVEDLSEIYLYGEAVEDQLLEGLQNSHDVRIHRANPFKKIKVSTQITDEINDTRPERFMISVGATLRGIQ